MSRQFLSWAVLAAAFTLVLGRTDTQAGDWWSNRGCCQNSNYGSGYCGSSNYGSGYWRSGYCGSSNYGSGYCGSSNYGSGYWGSGNCGNQQVANQDWQQTQQVSYVTTNTCCRPRATCCAAQSSSATSFTPASFSAPQQPPLEPAATSPAPGN